MTSKLKKLFFFSLFIFSFQVTLGQIFVSSDLPLIVINTGGQAILDEPKIIADMGIIWNGPGKRNTLNDPMNNYKGKIGIEIRGSSSQMFPKKSYSVETKSGDLASADVSLLGMPAENDWVLYAPYTDKTMIRDVMTYTLDASLGHWSPRCRFVELFLNGSYQGVYVLIEKIKRNKKRVNIAKLTTTDNTGEDLTGGYIIKIDKITGNSGTGWYSDYSNTSGRTYYQFDYPKPDVVTAQQRSYIQNYVKRMEAALYQSKYTGAGNYHEFLNDSSFVDFMIINELARNVDGYRLSSFLYKGKKRSFELWPYLGFQSGLWKCRLLPGMVGLWFSIFNHINTIYRRARCLANPILVEQITSRPIVCQSFEKKMGHFTPKGTFQSADHVCYRQFNECNLRSKRS